MYRTAMRSASRPALRSVAPRQFVPRRFASSASPADKPRSWKSSAVRWGLAGAAFYYYCTNPMFADATRPQAIVAPPTTDSDLPTVDSVLEEKRKQIREKSSHSEASTAPSTPKQDESKTSSEAQPQATQADGSEAPSGPAALEEEAGQQGAFNPETGEINWDCPCLGGMAHGPCGEEFKTAFSCFVYSEADPKGMDCIEKFQGMQECFRQYPEIYGAELGDEEDEGQDAPEAIPEAAPEAAIKTAPEATPEAPVLVSKEPIDDDFQKLREEGPKSAGRESNAMSADPVGAEPANEAVPANWEDATAANEQFKNEEKASQSKA